MNAEADVGKVAAYCLNNVCGRFWNGRKHCRAGLAHVGAQVVAHGTHKVVTHAGVKGVAAKVDPLALRADAQRGLFCGLGLRSSLRRRGSLRRRCRIRCRHHVLGVLELGLLRVLLGICYLGFLAHKSPLSQSSWPDSLATCSKVLFRMSMVMSAVCW